MDITFMIGNGFDINCGLACTYKDAYKTYIAKKSDNPVIEAFKARIGEDIDSWADFEVAMADDIQNYMSENDFLMCLRDFKVHLRKHLQIEERSFYNRLSELSKVDNNCIKVELNDSFEGFFFGISHNVSNDVQTKLKQTPIRYYAINFNYTTVFDNLFGISLKSPAQLKSEVIHIHGTLDDDIVLGMDNEQQITETVKVPYIFSNKGRRAFIKPFFNQSFDSQRVSFAKQAIKQSDVICVYGMSLGESDLTWRNLLFDWISKDTSRQLFIYRYNLASVHCRTVDERMDYQEDEKEKFLKSLGAEQDSIDKYIDQIHIPCGKNIFNIKDAILREEKKRKEIEDGKKAIVAMLEKNSKQNI